MINRNPFSQNHSVFNRFIQKKNHTTHAKRSPYLPMYIANFIIEYCNKKGYQINNLKLQKILYFLQARFLVEENKTLFDEDIRKWRYGPTTPSVYDEYKNKQASHIETKDIKTILRTPQEDENVNFLGMYVREEFDPEFITNKDQSIIKETVDALDKYSPFELVNITRDHGIWKNSKEDILNGIPDLIYQNAEIKIFFKNNNKEQLWKV